MIAAGTPQEFVPYGCECLAQHPGDVYLRTDVTLSGDIVQDTNRDILKALKGVSLQDIQERERFLLRKIPDEEGEEEIFIHGCSVVWCKTSEHGTRRVEKIFTVENCVQQALWSVFCNKDDKPQLRTEVDVHPDKGDKIYGICVQDSSNLSVFLRDGQEFSVALPFQVSKMWETCFGLLFECSLSSTDTQSEAGELLPRLFSMLHPLDEVAPVVLKTRGPSSSLYKLSYFCSQDDVVVFTSRNPSLLVMFHNLDGVHSVWKIRKTTSEEASQACIRTVCDSGSAPSCSWLTHTPVGQGSGLPTSSSSSSHSRHNYAGHSPSHTSYSPYRSNQTSRAATPSSVSRTQSPGLGASGLKHMATLSRSQSPLVTGTSPRRFTFTPPGRSYWTQATPRSFVHNESLHELIEPLAPDICLEHVWSEPESCRSGRKASKVFFTTDVTGQCFLCLKLSDMNQLRLIKFEESNDRSQLIFGSTKTILAQDAENLSSLKMMLTLDVSNSLTLYTGIHKICKVHIPSIPGPLSMLLGGGGSRRSSGIPSTPRRSSLVTSSRPPSAMDAHFDAEVQLLSPVLTQFSEEMSAVEDSNQRYIGVITGLRDAVENRVTLETASGTLYRVSLPRVSMSSIVSKCLQVLRNVLPRDVSLQVFSKWYTIRNAPGPCDISAYFELQSFLTCLLGMLGYNTEHLHVGGLMDKDLSFSPVAVKKLKTSNQGSGQDWNSLILSAHHQGCRGQREVLSFTNSTEQDTCVGDVEVNYPLSNSGLLFPYLPVVLYGLHLLYEDCKLNSLQWDFIPKLAGLLYQLSMDLRLPLYLDHYWRDFPQLITSTKFSVQLAENDYQRIQFPSYFVLHPPVIFSWLQSSLTLKRVQPFPYIPYVTQEIYRIVLLYSILSERTGRSDSHMGRNLQKVSAPGQRVMEEEVISLTGNMTMSQKIIHTMKELGMACQDINILPTAVALPIQHVIICCRKNPPPDLPIESYILIGRQDLATLASGTVPQIRLSSAVSVKGMFKHPVSKDEEGGLDQLDNEVLRLRFGEDQRVQEVYRLLQSSKPVSVVIQQRPEVSDHEFIEEQQRHLYSICIRTMALPVGRGMFTLGSYTQPVVTEALPIPKLCLTGKAPGPRNTTIDLSHIDVPANMSTWPLFHNGVAAGLRVSSSASNIDSTWILYNKPKTSSNDTPTEHAGFLLALGLNGHLKNLSTMSIHDYLCKGHQLTSVGLLLGIAAAMRGSMNVAVTKLMSIHVEALLPPTSTELDIPPMVQVASVLGIGLLYQGSAHRHMAEVLLGEIGRPPGPEMEHCVDRESYALSAGLALGLVTLGRGTEMVGMSDLPLADHLYHYMVGGHRHNLTGVHRERYRSPSYQIREGDCVNVDVTGPGATLALGMMFFNTGNRAVAEWMVAPDTQYLLDMVRPDFLLLRTCSKGLILWAEVIPSIRWVESHLPEIVLKHAFVSGERNIDVDCESTSQAYSNIIAGACLCLGLKFAGSANQEAYTVLMHYVRKFLSLLGQTVAEQAGKSVIETCMDTVVISLAMVMAGSGDLEVMRICRHLRTRIGQANSYVLYGSHMATHMALGLLFLGGGRYTLSTRPEAIGALICAFFPKFPTHSNDNRYHLQALRHLYVLAVEPRQVIPRDFDTGKAVYCHLLVRFKDTMMYTGEEYEVKAPCLLPELDLLENVIVQDSRYWEIVFDCKKNWNNLRHLLANGGNLYVKQKAGCLPYSEDPKGFKSVFAQSMVKDSIKGWNVTPTPVTVFSCNPVALKFYEYFLKPRVKTSKKSHWQQQMCTLLFESVSEEKTEILSAYIALDQIVDQISRTDQTLDLWQVKLLLAYSQWQAFRQEEHPLLQPEFTVVVKNRSEQKLQEITRGNKINLRNYFCHSGCPPVASVAPFLVYYDIPQQETVDLSLAEGTLSLPGLFLRLQDLSPSVASLMALLSVVSKPDSPH
ncbi:anaphase promoting complex subunit 1 isoform X2 [Tachypleus tridentatus]|uniref:anaphase promoting complex subunit 1 isoform X2 n=1 Tax=Tachypleus tridentatus TaxID=6853 RepID=UPI003FCFB6B0